MAATSIQVRHLRQKTRRRSLEQPRQMLNREYGLVCSGTSVLVMVYEQRSAQGQHYFTRDEVHLACAGRNSFSRQNRPPLLVQRRIRRIEKLGNSVRHQRFSSQFHWPGVWKPVRELYANRHHFVNSKPPPGPVLTSSTALTNCALIVQRIAARSRLTNPTSASAQSRHLAAACNSGIWALTSGRTTRRLSQLEHVGADR